MFDYRGPWNLRSQWGANVVQILQYLSLRLNNACFVIRDRILPAEGSDDLLSFLQVMPGHAGEQMVLYLVVQSTVQEVVYMTRLYIPGGENLPSQEI